MRKLKKDIILTSEIKIYQMLTEKKKIMCGKLLRIYKKKMLNHLIVLKNYEIFVLTNKFFKYFERFLNFLRV